MIYITRPEAAKILDTSVGYVIKLELSKNRGFPESFKFCRGACMYDKDKIEKWAKDNTIRKKQRANKDSGNELELINRFIRGEFDREEKQEEYRLKKIRRSVKLQ